MKRNFTPKLGYVLSACLCSLVSGCADGALGRRGSPAWYLTASKSDIERYEKSGGTRSGYTGSYSARSDNYSSGASDQNLSPLESGSKITSTGKIRNPDGSLSRLSVSGRRIIHSDGSSSRVTSTGKIRNPDGGTCRPSHLNPRKLFCY